MDIYEAVERRISCRSYADKEVETEILDNLRQYIESINQESGCHFQLYGPRGEEETAIDVTPSVFVGPVYHYIACVGPNNIIGSEKIGYYGEKLVLYATQLGLGTCWVVSNYKRETLRYKAGSQELLLGVITLGYAMRRTPTRQWLIRANFRQKDKTPEQLIVSDTDEIPDWIADGVKCVIIGPSGANMMPFIFEWKKGALSAYMDIHMLGKTIPFQIINLGIAKLHFEIGSRKHGTWQWGEHGVFQIEES